MMSNEAQVRVLSLTPVGAEQRLNELMSTVSPDEAMVIAAARNHL